MSDPVPAVPETIRRRAQAWAALRPAMIRPDRKPAAFTRDEWAYLMLFLDGASLLEPWTDAFGHRPRLHPSPAGPVAVWTPGNVSLLGPLTTVLLTLTGCPVRVKTPPAGTDLTSPFLDFARTHSPELRAWIDAEVQCVSFDRHDPRNAEWAAAAAVRIVFGSDAACAAIDRLPHPLHSRQFSFSDHRSVAWIDPAALGSGDIDTLLKVFAIYGRAGCTSPSEVVLIGGDASAARALRDELAARWQQRNPAPAEPHLASAHTLADQWARALGHETRLTAGRGALFSSGEASLPRHDGPFALPITWIAGPEEAAALLPANIQTVGYLAQPSLPPSWLAAVAPTPAARLVPLPAMHHFRHVWDGFDFWSACFRLLDVG